MSLLGDLRDHLLNFTEVTALIGDRIYINRKPRGGADTYVIVSRVSGETPYSLAGEVGTTQTLMQINCWSRDPNGAFVADQLSEAIRNLLSGYRGIWGKRFINSCVLTGEPSEVDDPPDDGSDHWFHGITQDYRVTHGQTVPTLT